MNILAWASVDFKGHYLDNNWISWKVINGELIGKRCVSSKEGYRYCWLEDVPKDETVHKYFHGKDADYNEIIKYDRTKR